jgi:hypothetical protein
LLGIVDRQEISGQEASGKPVLCPISAQIPHVVGYSSNPPAGVLACGTVYPDMVNAPVESGAGCWAKEAFRKRA